GAPHARLRRRAGERGADVARRFDALRGRARQRQHAGRPGVRGPGDDRAPAGHRAAVGRVAPPATRGPSTAVAPMLATLTGRLPRDPDAWGFEFKWDGVRAIVGVDERGVTATSRNRLDITGRYPELDALTAALAGRTAVLDGEVVAPDERGRPSFQRLQRRMHVATG